MGLYSAKYFPFGPKYGTLEDRKRCLPSEYKTYNGDAPINYGNVMEKLYISRDADEPKRIVGRGSKT